MSRKPSTTATPTNITIPGGAISNSTIRTGKLSVSRPTIGDMIRPCDIPTQSAYCHSVEITSFVFRMAFQKDCVVVSAEVFMMLSKTLTGAFDLYATFDPLCNNLAGAYSTFIGFENAEDAALFQIMIGAS